MSEVAAVVLAAGLSRRLGRPKQLLVLDGQPLVVHVVRRALAGEVNRVVVVTGAQDAEIREALDAFPVEIVFNPRFAEGQGTSLAMGIAVLSEGVDAAVILLADQPGVRPGTIRAAVDARRKTGAPVVMAQYGRERGHPVLFGRETFPELLTLDADMGGREVVAAHRDAVVLVDGGSATPPPDVDTEEDWAALRLGWVTDSTDGG